MILSAVPTTLCSDFLSEALGLPEQIETRQVSTLSMAPTDLLLIDIKKKKKSQIYTADSVQDR